MADSSNDGAEMSDMRSGVAEPDSVSNSPPVGDSAHIAPESLSMPNMIPGESVRGQEESAQGDSVHGSGEFDIHSSPLHTHLEAPALPLPDEPLPETISVAFPPSGPMGITFSNIKSRLVISSFALLPDETLGPKAGKGVLEIGDVLQNVNGRDISDLSFGEQVNVMRSSEYKDSNAEGGTGRGEERVLTFVRGGDVLEGKKSTVVKEVVNNPLLMLMSEESMGQEEGEGEDNNIDDIENGDSSDQPASAHQSASQPASPTSDDNPNEPSPSSPTSQSSELSVDLSTEEKKDNNPSPLPFGSKVPSPDIMDGMLDILSSDVKPNTANTARSSMKSGRSAKSEARSESSADSGTSTILSMLQRKRSNREDSEKRQKEREEALLKTKVYHPYQIRLMAALNGNERLGPPLHVKVTNESYWFKQRKLLGGSNHAKRMVQQEKMGTKYQAAIYDLKRREEDFELSPAIKYLPGLYSTSAKAYRACEDACAIRDANPAEIVGDKTTFRANPALVLCTHLNVTVVSEEFRGKSHTERCEMVYEALVEEFFENPGSTETDPNLASEENPFPERSLPKNFCVRGEAVNNLPHMKHLSSLPFELLFDLRTPSQYDPSYYMPSESERTTKSRTGVNVLGINKNVKTPSKIKNLRGIMKIPTNSRGGMYAHFFHDMPSDVKGLVLEEYQKNIKLIQGDKATLEAGTYKKTVVRTGQAKPSDPRLPDGGVGEGKGGPHRSMEQAAAAMNAASRALELGEDPGLAAQKAAQEWADEQAGIKKLGEKEKQKKRDEEEMKRKQAVLGQRQPGQESEKDSENDIITKYQILTKKVAAIAKRLQRIYRRRMMPRIQRRMAKKHYACLLVQRRVRAYYAREYVTVLKEVIAVAVVKIQALSRGVIGRIKARELRKLLTDTALVLQPVVRGWIGRTYASWLRENWKRAVIMQRIVRGFNHRMKLRKARMDAFSRCLPVYVIKIQSVARGFLGRKLFRKLMERLVFNKILVPACQVLQRCYRGKIGWRVGFHKRLERDAAIEIQRIGRGLLKRRWLAYVKWKKYERRCAVFLQSHVRGWIDREIIRRRRQKRYFVNVVVPSVTRIQAVYRGYTKRNELVVLQTEWFNAQRIQGCFRTYTAKKLARQKWLEFMLALKSENALRIQRLFRGWWWRRAHSQHKIREAARRLYASRIIMRGWIRYRDGKRYRVIKEAWEVEQSAELLLDLDEEKREILEDLEDINFDLAVNEKALRKANKRIKEILYFNEQAALRIPRVEWELENMDGAKDIEGGWAEAFSDEWERLHNQTRMSREELRLCKIKVRQLQREIDNLHMEREDVQIDLDNIGCQEQEEFELLRRLEFMRAERKRDDEWEKRIRLEKNTWKVDDVRRNVIRRKRTDIDEIAEDLKQNRSRDDVSTISFWKKHDMKKSEKDSVKRRLRERAKKKIEQIRKQGEGNEKIRHTFDSVVSSSLDLLKQSTLNMRSQVTDLREDPKAMCRVCGRVYCECDQSVAPTETYFKKVGR